MPGCIIQAEHPEKGSTAATPQENVLKNLLNDVTRREVALSGLSDAMVGTSSGSAAVNTHSRRKDISKDTSAACTGITHAEHFGAGNAASAATPLETRR